jgi:hypothetical protein
MVYYAHNSIGNLFWDEVSKDFFYVSFYNYNAAEHLPWRNNVFIIPTRINMAWYRISQTYIFWGALYRAHVPGTRVRRDLCHPVQSRRLDFFQKNKGNIKFAGLHHKSPLATLKWRHIRAVKSSRSTGIMLFFVFLYFLNPANKRDIIF